MLADLSYTHTHTKTQRNFFQLKESTPGDNLISYFERIKSAGKGNKVAVKVIKTNIKTNLKRNFINEYVYS